MVLAAGGVEGVQASNAPAKNYRLCRIS